MRALVLALALASPAMAETVYLGPEVRTAGEAPGVVTRTEITAWRPHPGGAAASLRHTEWQAGWEAEAAIACADLSVAWRQVGGAAAFTLRIGAEAPVLVLPGAEIALAQPEDLGAGIEAAVAAFGTGQATWVLIADLPRLGPLSGLLVARACG